MTELQGFMYPRTPTGAAGILPGPPWHYSGEMLTIEFRTDPANVAELLPAPLELAETDPGTAEPRLHKPMSAGLRCRQGENFNQEASNSSACGDHPCRVVVASADNDP